MNFYYRLFFLTLFISSINSFSQKYNKGYLQQQNKKIRDEIKQLNIELSKTKKEFEQSILYFTQLNKKIEARSIFINNTFKEKCFIEDEIHIKQLNINKLNIELKGLRKEYREILIRAYKNKSIQNKMLFFFTSTDFSQAIRRLKYLEKYGTCQINKSKEIIRKRNQIIKSIQEREKSKLEKEKLLIVQQKEISVLNNEKKEKEKIVQKFKNDENGVLTKLKEKQQVAVNLERDIEKSIREEITIAKAKRELKLKRRKEEKLKIQREAQEKKRKEVKELAEKQKLEYKKNQLTIINPSTSKFLKNTKIKKIDSEKLLEKDKKLDKILPSIEYEKSEEIELSESFISNQKRLPWPVESGSIVSRFGKQLHPVLPNITINNAGIEFLAGKGANSRSVFSGEVFKIQSIPGGNMAIMISHGDYFTIYTNLEQVYVKVGDKVNARQNLGKVYIDDNGNTLAGFQIWKGTKKLDPALWLVNL